MKKIIKIKNALISFIIIILLLTLNYLNLTPKYINTLSNSDTPANQNEEIKNNIAENKQTKTIGFIKGISSKDRTISITFDPVEFYIFDEADVERAKDGLDTSVVPYYIRNNTTDTTTYTLSKDAITNLCVYLVNDNYDNASINVPVSMDNFINYVSSNLNNNERSLLFWFETSENNIISTEMQYTP